MKSSQFSEPVQSEQTPEDKYFITKMNYSYPYTVNPERYQHRVRFVHIVKHMDHSICRDKYKRGNFCYNDHYRNYKMQTHLSVAFPVRIQNNFKVIVDQRSNGVNGGNIENGEADMSLHEA